MAKHVLVFVIVLLLASMVNAAPTVFFNSMYFNNQPFGTIDFEGTQGTISGINSYLTGYNATASTSASIASGGGYYFTPFGSTGISSGGASFTIQFNTAVKAAGGFAMGWEGNENPETGGVGSKMRVTLANGGGVYEYYYHQYSQLLISSPDRVNGFFGVYDTTYGIAKIEYIWNRDSSGMDNFYFGNNINILGTNGPTNVLFSNMSTIPLPSQGIVPEPTGLFLLSFVLLGIFLKRRY